MNFKRDPWIFKQIATTSRREFGRGFQEHLHLILKDTYRISRWEILREFKDIYGFLWPLDIYWKGPLDVDLNVDLKDILTQIFKKISTTSRREFWWDFQQYEQLILKSKNKSNLFLLFFGTSRLGI